MGGYYKRQGEVVGGIIGGSSGTVRSETTTAVIGGDKDVLTNFGATGATSGIGILKATGSAILKAEIEALESVGMGKTISNPKVFTLDNQIATVTQGSEIPYQTTSELSLIHI